MEEPKEGDHTRSLSNRHRGFSAQFLNLNRNKRSITLDLKTGEGRTILKRLAATADVLVQNFRPGVVERLGIDEAAIRAVAPQIVYVSINGFGESGPYAGKPTYDPIIQALSGLTSVQGGSDAARPRLIRTVLPDKLTAVTAAQAITSALVGRLKSGKGQHVRLSMLDAVLAFLWASDMSAQSFVGQKVDGRTTASFIDLIYETQNGGVRHLFFCPADLPTRAASEIRSSSSIIADSMTGGTSSPTQDRRDLDGLVHPSIALQQLEALHDLLHRSIRQLGYGGIGNANPPRDLD